MNRTRQFGLSAALLALLVALAGVTVLEKIAIAQGRSGPALKVAPFFPLPLRQTCAHGQVWASRKTENANLQNELV